MKAIALRKFAAFLLLTPAVALSRPAPQALADCAGIMADNLRLACYDRLAARSAVPTTGLTGTGASSPPAQSATTTPLPATDGEAAATPEHSLSRYWELEPQDKRGTFAFRRHRDNYILLANYSFAPNAKPFTPFAALVPQESDLTHTELDFELSFKLKLLQDISAHHADLWFGYTQQSYWQAYNPQASSPFRETDYQPELMAVLPVDYHFLGLHGRLLNVGFVHQSNGQSSTLSRSWNRFYLQTGLERGNFTLLARVWKRVNESLSSDDNPDIVDYMGHGDLSGSYRWNGNRFSMLLRQNFNTNRGGTRLGWAFPLSKGIKGYVQLFSGYGQSLIDYNYSQKSIGFGVLIGD